MTICGSIHAADLSECRNIRDDAVRLFCYDRVAGPESKPAEPEQKTEEPTAAAPAPSTEPEAEKAQSVPAPETKSKPKKQRIEARIVGKFEGWSRGTRFKLDNGQTWESVGAGTHYSKSEAPAVVIERDFFGQNVMAVEGVKSKAVVQRVEEP